MHNTRPGRLARTHPPGVPYDLSPEFINELFTKHKIDYIIHGDDPCLLPDGTEIPMPQIDRCEIWHCPKEGAHKRVEVRADVDEFAAFTAALDVWKWKNHHAPNVIDKPKRGKKAAA